MVVVWPSEVAARSPHPFHMAMASCAINEQWQGNEVESPPEMKRRSANYQPTTWDYDSICSPNARDMEEEADGSSNKHAMHMADNNQLVDSLHAALIETVRKLLLSEEGNLPKSIRMVDQLQSLGIAYHFEEEIKSILSISMSMQSEVAHYGLKEDWSLAALMFRVLRANGVSASNDMLSGIRDRKYVDIGSGNPSDIDGLLALYEASFLGFPGETAVDQARTFAVENLRELQAPAFNGHRPRERRHLPLHWRSPRLQAIWSLKQCFDGHQGDHQSDRPVVEPSILQLAIMDFNLVQATHREELTNITKWWKESGLGEKLVFARDRVVECFFCATCIVPQPHLGECREVLAKVGSLIVHLDDIYDVYGTLDELEHFTNAIGRWRNVSAAATLPEYMKTMYSVILTTSATAAGSVHAKQGYDALPLYMKGWHELCKAFLVEARWQQQGYNPSFEEYLSNGWVTSTGPLLLLHALPTITNDQHHIINMLSNSNHVNATISYPRQVYLSSRIFRLCNDCATHNAEEERGDAPSSIACYMMEKGVSEEEARAAVEDAIAEAWKELNHEVIASNGPSNMNLFSSTSMANLCLNLARIIHCIYMEGDGITLPTGHMKHLVKDLLFNPIPVQQNHENRLAD